VLDGNGYAVKVRRDFCPSETILRNEVKSRKYGGRLKINWFFIARSLAMPLTAIDFVRTSAILPDG
jgi:hypothetical protein